MKSISASAEDGTGAVSVDAGAGAVSADAGASVVPDFWDPFLVKTDLVGIELCALDPIEGPDDGFKAPGISSLYSVMVGLSRAVDGYDELPISFCFGGPYLRRERFRVLLSTGFPQWVHIGVGILGGAVHGQFGIQIDWKIWSISAAGVE